MKVTIAACHLLGDRIRLARLERRWSEAELAERVGVSRATLRKIEKGDPRVVLGTVFDACVILGIPLFDDENAIEAHRARLADKIAVLPARVRKPIEVDDDF
jgi:transcriptional regulator with XRE-family HTH domain